MVTVEDVNDNIDDAVKFKNEHFTSKNGGRVDECDEEQNVVDDAYENDDMDEIESDDDLTTIGSSSPFDIESLQKKPQEDWELEILRDSPFYCEGDESEDSLTGPYKILFKEQQNKSRYVLRRDI